MERPQPLIPQKSSSFSSTTTREDKKLRETDRNLSLDSVKFTDRFAKRDQADDNKPARIDEEDEDEAKDDEDTLEKNEADENNNTETNLTTLSDDIDRLINNLRDGSTEVPNTVDRFVALVEREIMRYEAGDEKFSPDKEEIPFLDALNRLSNLASVLSNDPKHTNAMSHAGGILHHAMCFLEDEFFALLDEPRAKLHQDQASAKTKRGQSFSRGNHEQQPDRCVLPQSPAGSDAAAEAAFPTYPPEVVSRLQSIAAAMLSAGYQTECCQVFSIARRNAAEAGISELGVDKVSIDDLQRMPWDSLEVEIPKWIKAFRYTITDAFPHERDLCNEVFSGHAGLAGDIFRDLARSVIIQLLNFAEAVAMTKRSAEKLFKVLDMYEALRDTTPKIVDLFPVTIGEGASEGEGECLTDLKSEISSARSRLGEAAVAIFCDLEGSIKSDTGKTPVPSGAVHPLTRYVMNYLKYACEYANAMDQVFKEHQKLEKPASHHFDSNTDGNDSSAHIRNDGQGASSSSSNNHKTPFSSQIVQVMDLLHSNIEGKSKLYKDLALSNIFMMNNGRYIVQKIKGSTEINHLLGDTWCRKRSSDLRQYHKNYQRETWAKVLACFKEEGLTVKGSIHKPILKDRFKNFNAMFEEIHRTQSSWVVSDEQLQSELRVSVSAVVVPAYRSFLGRFSQIFTPGRQTEKYIKFGAEDLETYIDELFDGNPASGSGIRKRT